MTWIPLTHSDTTDMVASAPVPFDAEHAPLDFQLSDQDLAVAAAARYHRRAELARLNSTHKEPTK